MQQLILVSDTKEDIMHDLDRTQAEFWETDGEEIEQYELMGEEEMYEEESEGIFSETDEIELASELLEVGDEAELEQFLGKLFKKVGRATGGAILPPTGRALARMLRRVAKRALPAAGNALGDDDATGGKPASAAEALFGLELEGLSGEDQEFEIARQFVRLAGEAAENAAQAPEDATPQAAAQGALADAAAQHAPGLLAQAGLGASNGTSKPSGVSSGGGTSDSSRMTGRRSGRWMRRGNRIVLYGL
jgi:hypothetical protein